MRDDGRSRSLSVVTPNAHVCKPRDLSCPIFSSLHHVQVQSSNNPILKEKHNMQHPQTDEQKAAELLARLADLEKRVAELESKVNQ